MTDITLSDELAKRLEALARREKRSVVDVIAAWVEENEAKLETEQNEYDPITSIIGIYDDDITDMSTTVRETLQKYYQEKYGDSD
jgi:hypothetical protein